MRGIDRATGPAPWTGRPSRTPCEHGASCIVELTEDIDRCRLPKRECSVKEYITGKKLERCGIYRRFRQCTFVNIEESGVPESVREQYSQVKDFAQSLKENLAAGRGLLLKGAVGTMKTTLAAAVLQAHVAAGGSGLFITMSSLLDNIFTLKAQSLEEWVKFERRLRETPLLILDDLGAEHTEGWVLTKVDAIIAERYNRCRSVIVTTNLTAEQLRGFYAERVIDRLRSTLKVINFSGRSLRVPV
jgi:DNA replication protein DnaC